MRVQIEPKIIARKEFYCDLCKHHFIVQTDLYNVQAKFQFLIEEVQFAIHFSECANKRLEVYLGKEVGHGF